MKWLGKHLAAVLISAAIVPATLPCLGQGCAQCKDNTAATPPATQRAYRHAILILTVTAGGLFAAAVSMLRRNH